MCLSESRLHYVGQAGWEVVMLIAQAAFKHTVFLPQAPGAGVAGIAIARGWPMHLYLIHSGEVKAANAGATE